MGFLFEAGCGQNNIARVNSKLKEALEKWSFVCVDLSLICCQLGEEGHFGQ